MNEEQRIRMKQKFADAGEQSALRKADVIGSVCPTCNAKGYRTTLTKNSYACKKCGTWWAN
jgi:acetyl-CoA carboxylase beta subunit